MKSSLPRTFWSAKQNGQWSVDTTCKMVVSQSIPKLREDFLPSRSGGVNTYLAPSKFGRASSFDGEQQILGTRFGERRQPAITRLAHLIQRVF